LKKDIATAGAPVVLALGDAALTAVAHNWDIPMGAARKVQAGQLRIASLKQQQGSPITLPDGTIAVASYHPNFGFTKGSRHYLQVIREFILRAARIAVRGYIDWKEPDYILSPSVEVIEATLERMWQSDSPITIDLETDKGTREDGEFDPFSCRIRCIGFGAVLDGEEVVICVPIRRIDGTDWWSAENKQRVLRACMNALNSNELVGHNLNFDTQVLLRVGLIAKENERRTFDDTMLMHRNTPHCDLPHGLGFVSAAYFEVPSWKGAADDKYYENVTDYDLQLYNVKDVCNTMRLHMRLQEELLRWNTTKQYAVDKALAPVVRDMGNRLGLFIDEEKRGQFLLDMSSKAFESLRRLKTIVGDPKFNPSSPHQVRKYLFVDKGLTPQINTDMKAWKKGEDPATGVQALMKLASSSSVPEDVKDFIETLLEYRQFMKLKGTYLEKLRVSYPDWKKEFGIDVPMMPEVKGQVWREYSTSERIALMPEDVQSVWKGISREEQKRMLTMVPEGKWEEYIALPERPKVSRLFITYKQHIVSSGRLSSSPNAQNYPKFGKVNTHEMFIAPPGHVMVGADFDQVELRVYAAVANDKLLRDAYTKPGPDGKPFDPHSLNAASMFSKKFGMTIEQAYLYIVGLPEKQKKKLRGYAKTFCIAEGQNVLTLRGEVPIETVRIDDLLWDGVEWVRHDGVVCMGTKPVIQWDGLTATPEHEVWTDSHGKIRFDQAKEGKVLLSRTSAGGRPVRYSDSCGKTMESGNPLAGSRKVPPMSRAERMRLRKHSQT
jgi:DNA polymerase I-like protein with 3'-5' exonuclease and polymerase domains